MKWHFPSRLFSFHNLIVITSFLISSFTYAASIDDANQAFESGNLSLAKDLYLPLAESGDKVAQTQLARIYNTDDSPLRDLSEARYWFNQAAEQGVPLAQTNLANMYLYGEGTNQDLWRAVDWMLKAANQGYFLAQNNLGVMYRDALGVNRNYEQALKWFELSAEQGYKPAIMNLADMYRLGKGVNKNRYEVIRLYRVGADDGDPAFMMRLAQFYFSAQPKDYKEAISWLSKPELENDPLAIENIGVIYGMNDNPDQDLAKSLEYIKRSAELGYKHAQFNTGLIYYKGIGVPINYQYAFDWFIKAAKQNDPTAQYYLKEIYSKGQGRKKDLVKAQVWENLSFENGIEAGLRDSFLHELKPNQKDQVLALIAQCKATKLEQCE